MCQALRRAHRGRGGRPDTPQRYRGRQAAAAEPRRDAPAHPGAGQAPAPGGARCRGPSRSILRAGDTHRPPSGGTTRPEVGRSGPRRRLPPGPAHACHNEEWLRLHIPEDDRFPARREAYSEGHRRPQKPPGGQLTEIDRVGSLWSQNGLIFASETGDPLNRHNFTRRSFKPLLKRAGLPEIRFHDLRHTCATLLLTRNVNPKIVSEMLGHSSIVITLDTYSHVLPNMRDAAAAAMEEALS